MLFGWASGRSFYSELLSALMGAHFLEFEASEQPLLYYSKWRQS